MYVGESSRSICERFREHVKDNKKNLETSHMTKHETLIHGDINNKPYYDVRVKKFCKTPIERQVLEAVTIAARANETGVYIMNSKSEFNRCTLPRIVMYSGDKSEEDTNKAGQNELNGEQGGVPEGNPKKIKIKQ